MANTYAERIADAIRSGRALAVADAPQLASLEEAEAVQDEVVHLLGWRATAWKLGASNQASRAGLGLPRSFSAGLPAERLLHSPAQLRMDQPRQPGIECELCVGFAVSPGAAGELMKLDDVALRACVRAAAGSFHAAIELPGSRFPALGAAGPFALVADNGAADYIVIGAPAPVAFDRPLWRAQVLVDDRVAQEGDTSVFCDTPLALLTDHVRRMAVRGQEIAAGAVVIIGSVTPRLPVEAPCKVTIQFEDLPPVDLEFTPAT